MIHRYTTKIEDCCFQGIEMILERSSISKMLQRMGKAHFLLRVRTRHVDSERQRSNTDVAITIKANVSPIHRP